jgi:hypothetical protein
MKSLVLCIVLVTLSLLLRVVRFKVKQLLLLCHHRRRRMFSNLISEDLSFAKEFVQSLSDAG